jgi:hypothetical protein
MGRNKWLTVIDKNAKDVRTDSEVTEQVLTQKYPARYYSF